MPCFFCSPAAVDFQSSNPPGVTGWKLAAGMFAAGSLALAGLAAVPTVAADSPEEPPKVSIHKYLCSKVARVCPGRKEMY